MGDVRERDRSIPLVNATTCPVATFELSFLRATVARFSPLLTHMHILWKDIRYGIRTLAANRPFAILAIATLGLGIGANTAIFSVIDGVLLKPLPYASGDRLVLIRQSAPLAGRPDAGVSVQEYYDYREQTHAFDRLVEYHQMNFDLLNRGEPDRVSTGVVSHDFFDVLGIAPIMGRTFRADDDKPGADAVLVLSHSYWQQKLGGDPHVLGQVFQMNDRPHTVVGVLPNVPHYPQENDVYMPVSACPFRAAAETARLQNRRAFGFLTVFGRLRPGITPGRADSDVEAICRRFVDDNPTIYRRGSGFMATTLNIRDEMTKNAQPMLLVLLGTTALVLLIACANVANLTIARLMRRDRELAVRAALGASRGRLIRQLLTESILIATAGGAVGVFFAAWTIDMLTTFVGRFTTRTSQIGLDPWVLAFAVAISITTGLVFGTFPALSSRTNVADTMKRNTKGSGVGTGQKRIQRALIVVQVAVSVVLLSGAGLLLASFHRLQTVDAGYRADHVLSAEVFTNFTKYPTPAAQIGFYQPLIQRLQAEPGITAVAVTNAVPLSTLQPANNAFQIEGRRDGEESRATADVRIITPGYFTTLGIPLLAGRFFSDADKTDGLAVTVINKTMTRYWSDKSPVGSRVSFDNGKSWVTVVGVVGDVRQFGLANEAAAQSYVPLAQANGIGGARVLIRTASDPTDAARTMRADVRAVDPNMPVENILTLDDIRQRYLAAPKLSAALLTIFAALAMLVTATGITGVIATSVTQRTQEFGLRMALGASRAQVIWMVSREGVGLVASGLVLGAGVSLVGSRVMQTMLFNTPSADPLTFGCVAVVALIAGGLACAGPACRATAIDPIEALRTE